MKIEAFGFIPLPARAFGATAPAGKGNKTPRKILGMSCFILLRI